MTPPKATAPVTAPSRVLSEADTTRNPSAAIPKATAEVSGRRAVAAATSKARVAIPAGTHPRAAQVSPPYNNPTPAANHKKPGPTTRQAAIRAAPPATPADQMASTRVGLRLIRGPSVAGPRAYPKQVGSWKYEVRGSGESTSNLPC